MARYSNERKESILKKLLPPLNMTVAEVARQEGVSAQTLYNWRYEAKKLGKPVPGKKLSTEDWSAETKLAVVVETMPLSESELSQYCREKALYPEQVRRWKQECLQGFLNSETINAATHRQAKTDKNEIKALKRELRRKEKALAETAALLVLRKKPQCALGRRRGELTSFPERKKIVGLIHDARASGARLSVACQEAEVSLRTYRRWYRGGQVQVDRRPEIQRPEPSNKLSNEERQAIVDVANEAKYARSPPSQIVPALLDQGIYLGSESSFYRILNERGQLNHRGRSQAPKKIMRPTSHTASGPNEVWSWDITYLASTVRGQFYYLYLFEDIFSRKIVGYEVHEQECGERAAELIQRCMLREQCLGKPVVLHSDNGAPMKSQTMKAKMEELGVLSSYSRPRVSNDNPFSESLFRTLKYRPEWPSSGFASLSDARSWVQNFSDWYNNEHRHSKLNFVTPAQRHAGLDEVLLLKRKHVLETAKAARPDRWSKDVRNCKPIGAVTLNPEEQRQLPIKVAA
ncbi:IS3 family transposase [Zhongshania sp.]|uniref:IS3 family transposase n=1 Tax=Zhongshania sp. TaxID=1971902 RepID=UPI003563172E